MDATAYGRVAIAARGDVADGAAVCSKISARRREEEKGAPPNGAGVALSAHVCRPVLQKKWARASPIWATWAFRDCEATRVFCITIPAMFRSVPLLESFVHVAQ